VETLEVTYWHWSVAAASAQAFSSRLVRITFAPACTKPFAIMKPTPREPPVTNTFLFATEKREAAACEVMTAIYFCMKLERRVFNILHSISFWCHKYWIFIVDDAMSDDCDILLAPISDRFARTTKRLNLNFRFLTPDARFPLLHSLARANLNPA
jgi:hypothetical protein